MKNNGNTIPSYVRTIVTTLFHIGNWRITMVFETDYTNIYHLYIFTLNKRQHNIRKKKIHECFVSNYQFFVSIKVINKLYGNWKRSALSIGFQNNLFGQILLHNSCIPVLNYVVIIFWSLAIMDCILFTFENIEFRSCARGRQ